MTKSMTDSNTCPALREIESEVTVLEETKNEEISTRRNRKKKSFDDKNPNLYLSNGFLKMTVVSVKYFHAVS